jgi:ADP-ribose pyrophosphatase YjhB (NUDIX family)
VRGIRPETSCGANVMRVEVRAVILIDGPLVLAEETRDGRPHRALPGGRVERWETLHEALVREVHEETGLVVEPGRLLYVAEVVSRFKLHDVDLVFSAIPIEPVPESLTLIDPAEASGRIMPPILGEIAHDIELGWPNEARWLGNLWDSSL